MKLECMQESLAEGLAVVGRVVPTRTPTLPVLSNVLISAQNGELQLAATNLDMAVAHRVPATVEREGQITLPARLLGDYVALLDHGQKVGLDLNPKTHKVHLSCGRYEANVAGIDAEDFPPLPQAGEGTSFTMDAATLKEAIAQVVFAAAPDDTRPVLAGALLHRSTNGTLILAAADGFRLAVRTLPVAEGGPELQVIIPARALNEVARLLPGEEGQEVTISCTTSQNQVFFAFGKTQVTSRLIEGQFPPYERIIPAEPKTKVTLSTNDFLRATRAAAVFARDNSNIVRLECTPPKENAELAMGQLMVKSTSAEMGDNEGLLDASVAGDAVQIAFNGKYLREALEVVETQQVALQITGPSSPGIIRPVGEPNGYLHVIMPMHVAR